MDQPKPPPMRETHLMHRSLVQQPHTVVAASGLELTLDNGRKVIDACGGAAVACLGHANEEVSSAIFAQSQNVGYVHTGTYTTTVAEELADLILDGSPFGLEKAYFVGSGSEAVEAAMKLARQYFFEKGEHQRLHFVARRQAYHGNTMASMSVSSNLSRKLPYQGFCYPHTSAVSPAFAYRYQKADESEADFTKRLLAELDEEFIRIGTDKVIAFIAEPVVGATAGCVTPPAGYLRGVKTLCEKYGILLILDEIMCGSGRCGTFFAFEPENVEPDIVTIAKGLAGGYAPIAGVLMHRKVVETLRQGSNAFNHGHTFQAHSISCAAALAVQKIVRRDGLVERSAKMGRILGALLKEKLSNCRSVGDIRGRGLFWAVEFVKDKATRDPFESSLLYGPKVQEAAFEGGVAIYPGHGTIDGVSGDHVLLAPPFTVDEAALERICDVLRDAILAQEALYM
ncbi:aminotransferase class-III domain-containing protein [Sarocladium implicatum]|nr:aminotransferase class-III domain-containing protein [Sarocladium implicatum]